MKEVEIDVKMRGYVISDDIVDVEFVEISDAPEASGTEMVPEQVDIVVVETFHHNTDHKRRALRRRSCLLG